MGLGIERRSERFSSAWEPHFKSSKTQQARWAETVSGKLLAVLGAGRLFDFEKALVDKFSGIDLIDADPLCQRNWRGLRRTFPKTAFGFYELELTGALSDWSVEAMRAFRRAEWKQALQTLEKLRPPSPSPFAGYLRDRRPDAILSLNVLSQLPVMWQDLLEIALVRRFGREQVKEREQEWLAAFAPSARVLVREHLGDLASADASEILILTDVEYLYYSLLSDGGAALDELPFEWRDGDNGGNWILKPAAEDSVGERWKSECFRMDALYGVNVENAKLLEVLFPSHTATPMESWLWHIVPETEGRGTHGVVHRVRALSLKPKGPARS